MSVIDKCGMGKGLAFGFALAAINPKNLALAAAAGLSLGSAGLDARADVLVMAMYLAIAGCTVIVVFGVVLIGHGIQNL